MKDGLGDRLHLVGGTIEVFVEPVDFREASDETCVYERLPQAREAGGRARSSHGSTRPATAPSTALLDTGIARAGSASASLAARAVTETQAR